MSGQLVSLSSSCCRAFKNFYTLEIDLGAKRQRLNSIANSCLSYSQYFTGKTTLKYENERFHPVTEKSENSPMIKTGNKASFAYRSVRVVLYGVVAIFATPMGTLARLVNCLYSREIRAAIFSAAQPSEPQKPTEQKPPDIATTTTPTTINSTPSSNPAAAPTPTAPAATSSSSIPAAPISGPIVNINPIELIQQVALGLVDSRRAPDNWIIEFNGQLREPLKIAVDFFKDFFAIKDETLKVVWIQTQKKYQYPFFIALVLLLKPLEDHLKTLDKMNYGLLQRYQKLCLPFLEQHQFSHLLQFAPPKTPRMVKHLIYTQPEYYLTDEAKIRDAKLRELLLKTPNLSMYFRMEYIFQEYKTVMVAQLRDYWRYELEKLQQFNKLPTPNSRLGVEGLRWCHDVNNIGYTPFGVRFSEDQFRVFELHESLLDPKFTEDYRRAYTIYQFRKDLYTLTEEQRGKKVSSKKIKSDKQIQVSQKLPSEKLIPFFQRFKAVPDEQASSWLKEQFESKDYCYPFYQAQSVLNFPVDAKKDLFSENELAQVEQLFTEAAERLKKIGLAKYLDEINEAFLVDAETGIKLLIEGLEQSRLPPQS